MTSCIICFNTSNQMHHCSNSHCHDTYCRECLMLLIDFCVEEKVMPQCPSRHCQSDLILNDLKGLNKTYIDKYCQLCLDYFMNNHKKQINHELQEKEVITRLINEKRQFLEETYPAAIALVATVVFDYKYRQMDKQKEKIKQTLQKNRPCFHTTCSGYLDNDYKCLSCQHLFCKQCEHQLTHHHQCKQVDVDCVNMIKNMVKCPGCQLPVFKNVGCNHITCSSCGVKFDYTTGQIGGSGSHNTKINIKKNVDYKLSDLYKETLPTSCQEKLLVIEASKPRVMSFNTLLGPLKKYKETKDVKLGKVFANKLNNYYLNRFLIRDYEDSLIQLETILKTTNNEKDMTNILNQCLILVKK